VCTLGFISLVAASGHRRTKPEEVRGPKPPYMLLILRDQSVVGSLGLICLVAASGHNYLALIR
jgi:hypothetical protein